MATVLIVEDAPAMAPRAANRFFARGHQVLRCGGGATPTGACPLLRSGRCALADSSDIVVFACVLAMPLVRRQYLGKHLLEAYRTHEQYGRLPMLVVGVTPPGAAGGTGPIDFLDATASGDEIVSAADRLLQSVAGARSGCVPTSTSRRRQVTVRARRRGGW